MWALSDGVLRCRSDEAVKEDAGLILSTELGDEFEFHFDFRAVSGADSQVILQAIDPPGADAIITISWPESGTGGVVYVPTGEWIGKSNPLGQRALAADRWNDARISLRRQKLQIHVNGVLFYDVQDPRFVGKHRIGLQTRAGEPSAQAWRYLRLWTRTDPGAPNSAVAIYRVDQ
jgi:hypothetical protein